MDGLPYILAIIPEDLALKDARKVHKWISRVIAWREDQEKRK